MTERNKLLAVLVVGLLVGFGVGRVLPTTPAQIDDKSDEGVVMVEKKDGDAMRMVEDKGDVESPETGAQLGAAAAGALTHSAIERPQADRAGVGVSVLDQVAGENVLVSSVAVTAPTWVAVHSDRGGRPGNVLGARLVEANSGGVLISLLRPTEKLQTYYVVLQEDNGNGSYDLYIDPELVRPDGTLVFGAFVAQ